MRATTLLAILCFTTFVTRADDLQPPITTGLRVATCGHSFHVFTYHQVEQIAVAAGLKHQVVGLSSIGGSTVQKHWDVPEEKSAVKQGAEGRRSRCAHAFAHLAARRRHRAVRETRHRAQPRAAHHRAGILDAE
jgi:hypothetical protein